MPNDELTPEEKLLRVIQDRDGAKASGKAGVASAGPEVPAPKTAESPVVTINSDSEPDVMPQANSARGNLKLAEKSKGSTLAQPLVVPADDAAPASGDDMILSDAKYGRDDLPDNVPSDTVEPEAESVAASVATPVTKKRTTAVDGVLRINRLLLLAVLLILALIGVEIWANISAKPLPAPDSSAITLPEPVETTLPPWPQVIGIFDEKEWFPKPKPPDGETPDGLDHNAIAAFLKQNVKLVGLSMLPDGTPEALIADLLPDKMHFVKESDRLELGSSESPKLFTLKSIGSDHIVLSDGSDDYTVK